MKFLSALSFTLLTAFAFTSNAQEVDASIDDFAFLTGYWEGQGMGGGSEEVWMPPSGGRMFGIFKQSNADGLIFTELMEITEFEGQFILRLKHFNPDFSGWETKSEHLTFTLTSISKNAAEFGGLRYKLVDSSQLLIELDMHQSSGEVVTEEFLLNKD